MGADLDMNSNDILNVANINAGTVDASNFTVNGTSLNILLLDWEGPWIISTSYLVGDLVSNDGSSFICLVAHTSSGDSEPGVGINADTYWDLVASAGNGEGGGGSDTAAEILAKLVTVDGPGSGLDADTLDGLSSAAFTQIGGTDVTVSDGGTGRSSHTAYAVLCGGTTTTAAQQSIASVGTSGQVLTSNGAGALPTFQTPAAASSGLVLLTSGTVTSAAQLDLPLTSYTAYKGFKFYIDLVPATDNVALWMRFSTDGGSTYDATGYSYMEQYAANGGSGGNFTTNGNQIVLFGNTGNVADEGVMAEIVLYNPFSTTRYGRIAAQVMGTDTGGIAVGIYLVGQRNLAQDTTAVRFLFSSGNIASGTYALYGLA